MQSSDSNNQNFMQKWKSLMDKKQKILTASQSLLQTTTDGDLIIHQITPHKEIHSTCT
jgi:hypothetical protein